MDYVAHKNHTLEQHLLGVADKAKNFAAKINLNEQGELTGLLHDLGKYSSQFQGYLKSAIGLIDEDKDDYVDAQDLKGKVDHSTAGAIHAITNQIGRSAWAGEKQRAAYSGPSIWCIFQLVSVQSTNPNLLVRRIVIGNAGAGQQFSFDDSL